MKFLILNTDYPRVLDWLYSPHPGLGNRTYEEQMRARNESLFAVADFYSANLRKLGHEAWDVHANNEFMQRAWAKEHGVRISDPNLFIEFARAASRQVRHVRGGDAFADGVKYLLTKTFRQVKDRNNWLQEVLAEQIRYYQPDVLINPILGQTISALLRELKPYIRLLIGQIASPLPSDENVFRNYDLMISSLPNFVDYFRRLGIPSELHRLGFEPTVLEKLESKEKACIPISFVGSLFQVHRERIRLLELLSSEFEISIWGNHVEELPKSSRIRFRYVGPAWGIDMYHILSRSKITLNHHIDVAQSYANNMRLFEATGVGTLLITDWKENLHEMFEPGKEVVAYKSPEECVELIKYYLEHDEERQTIARAGQQRTLREHTYYQRMEELVRIVSKHLSVSWEQTLLLAVNGTETYQGL